MFIITNLGVVLNRLIKNTQGTCCKFLSLQGCQLLWGHITATLLCCSGKSKSVSVLQSFNSWFWMWCECVLEKSSQSACLLHTHEMQNSVINTHIHTYVYLSSFMFVHKCIYIQLYLSTYLFVYLCMCMCVYIYI